MANPNANSGAITLRTEGGMCVLYGPDGTVRSRHYLRGGEEVHEVNPNSPATLRGVQASAVDPFAPSRLSGSEAAEISKSDPTQLIVRPPQGSKAKPLSLTRAGDGGTHVPRPRTPVIGAGKIVYTIADAIDSGEHCLIEGHPGLGKTYSCLYLASRLRYNCFVLQVSANIEEDQLTGTYRPVVIEDKNGNLVPIPKYVYSLVAKAVRASQDHPTILVWDELNRARSQGVFTVLFSLMEGGWLGGVFDEDGEQERIEAGDLHIVATQNPSPRNEVEGGMYLTSDLDDALLSRFRVQAQVDWPTPEEQAGILMAHVQGDPDVALKVSKMAHSVRTAKSDGLPQPLSTRALVAFFKRLTEGQDPEFCYESRINDILPAECRTAVRRYARGEGVIP